MSSPAIDPHADYIASLVRQDDRDRFLTAQYALPEARGDLLALYAFNAEVAKIRESVSEALLGQMKLQWWRDVIDAIYTGKGAPGGHPTAESLARIVGVRSLSRMHFEALLDARALDMAEEGPADMPALEAYAEGTSSRLMQLALEVLGQDAAGAALAARHAGIAWALTGILRAVPFQASAGRSFLPRDLLTAEGVSMRDLQADQATAPLRRVAAQLVQTAQSHLREARKQSCAAGALPALLPAAVAEQYLGRLRRNGFDILNVASTARGPGILGLTWAAWRGRF